MKTSLLSSRQIRNLQSELERDYARFEGDSDRRQAALDALQRIADGTYGRCLRCSTDIAFGRLLVMPETTYCISCAKTPEFLAMARN